MDSTAPRTVSRAQLLAAGQAWQTIEGVLGPLNARHTNANADRITGLIDALLEVCPGGTGPAGVASLLTFLMDWLAEYEAATLAPTPAPKPAELLQHLMDANNLRQIDLADILGGQSTVSAILRGKRTINLRQAQALAMRFCVSPAAFIEMPATSPPPSQFSAPSLAAQSFDVRRSTVSASAAAQLVAFGTVTHQQLAGGSAQSVHIQSTPHAH